MMKNYHSILIGLILISNLGALSAQENKGELKIDETVSYEIQKDESHQFTIDLEKD